MTTPLERYANSKIYKLVNDIDDETFIGSTCLPLRKRLSSHKIAAKSDMSRRMYAHLSSVGWDTVKIVLIEAYPCSNKDELVRHERRWVDELRPSLNRQIKSVRHDVEESRQYLSKDDSIKREVRERQDLQADQ